MVILNRFAAILFIAIPLSFVLLAAEFRAIAGPRSWESCDSQFGILRSDMKSIQSCLLGWARGCDRDDRLFQCCGQVARLGVLMGSLVAQCSATRNTVAARPPCSWIRFCKGEVLYPPSPSPIFLPRRHLLRASPPAGILYPPLLYTPPNPRRVFSGGGVCTKFGSPILIGN